MHPEEGSNAVQGLEGITCGEWLRTLGFSASEKRRLRGDPYCSVQLPEEGKGRARCWSLLKSLVSGVRVNHGNGSKLHPEKYQLVIRKDFLLKGWSNIVTVFLERWWMTQACQCSWTVPVATCLGFWSALKQSSSWTRWSL